MLSIGISRSNQLTSKMLKPITTLILLCNAITASSQAPSLSHFSKWGLHAGMAVYEKGTTSANEHYPAIEHKNGTSFYINVSRVNKIADRLNFETGFNIVQPIAYKFTFSIPESYLSNFNLEGVIRKTKTIGSIEIPVLFNYEMPLSRKQLLTFGVGLSILYMPYGGTRFISS
jgi:hypothetical protein